MSFIKLHLVPTPGAKPEFLAQIEFPAAAPSTNAANCLPPDIVLENYTRDEWATKPSKDVFQTMIVKSIPVEGRRNKVPGFLQYLKDRQKTAYGRFKTTVPTPKTTGVWTIGPTQPPSTKDSSSSRVICRYTLDINQLSNCPLVVAKPKIKQPPPPQQQQKQPQQQQPQLKKTPSTTTSAAPKKSGLLGNLLQGARRTNEHVIAATAPSSNRQQRISSSGGGGSNSIENGTTTTTTATATTGDYNDHDNNADGTTTTTSTPGNTKTGQQIIAEFREKMEQEMLDFDASGETSLKIPISLAEMTQGLVTQVEKQKVTMEVLKYIVYEQAEEINEEWVAAKEQSEFMDEITIAIYKEGHAPEEVLEDLNKGDLPDEIRGQQRAIQAETQKRMEQQEAKLQHKRMTQAHKSAEEEDLAQLNTEKRDRRTIEEIQRDMMLGEGGEHDANKRQRTS